ncbi:MAG: hydantoinase B/oxoprolinase family protein, partial [Myxococcales bacterium]|nr:hydantoinase B/oxoprolinase family protein [Myxococcales bacterium]
GRALDMILTGRPVPAPEAHAWGLVNRLVAPGQARGVAEALAAELAAAGLEVPTPERLAEGFIEIAVANMADAIKKISIERGHDLEEHALCCFGGAGGQHACLVADALGMRTVLIHPLAGVLSAYGMGLARVRALRERSLGAVLAGEDEHGALAGAEVVLAELREQALGALAEQGYGTAQVEVQAGAHLRYVGSDRPLTVSWRREDQGGAAAMRARFEAEHETRYGFALPEEPVVVDALVVEASSLAAEQELEASFMPQTVPGWSPAPRELVEVHMGGRRQPTPVFEREALDPGATIFGPAIIAERTATTVVEPGWEATVLAGDELLLQRSEQGAGQGAGSIDGEALARPDPVRLEVFNNLYGSIAEQMGATLRNTAHSVNIKERLDFSCAVFDGEGQLIANAPHMPVHLGSMGASVRAVLDRRRGTLRAGQAFVVNAPYNGG